VRGEALAAAAFGRDVGVLEHELFVQALLQEIDAGAVDQRQAVGVDQDRHAVLLEHGVAVAPFAGQVDQVAPARAARTLHAEAQADGRGIGRQEAPDAFEGGGGELDRHGGHCSRCGSGKLYGSYRLDPAGIQGMTTVSVAQALAGKVPEGGEVTVRGWVRTRRDSKAGLSFVNVSDGSCFAPIQVVAPSTLANYESEVKRLTAGCSVIATGTLAASQGQGQSFEIQAGSIEVVGWVEDPETYPIQPKAHSLEFLREVAHLRPRTNLFGAVTRIRDCLAKAVHRYFHENGYYWISTPIITTSDAEGAGQM